jgi:16S rRNA (cytidine1402-2'-O)-methyltransferase
VLPGPSAVTAALAVSGLPSDRFCFEGFPPRGQGDRARRFAELAAEPRTLVLFESRRRLASTLAALAEAFGPGRAAVVCRELTKTHEEVRRGTLGDLAAWAQTGPLGEITIVVAGAPPPRADPAEIGPRAAADVAARERAGVPRKAAMAEVARELGVRTRDVYDAVLRHRADLPDDSQA